MGWVMVDCFRCEQPKTPGGGCDPDRFLTFAIGQSKHQIPFGDERHTPTEDHCRECGAQQGRYHPGCPTEECPRCGKQYTTCDCDTKEKRYLAGTTSIEFA